ncbi:hypothetical protein ABZ770_16415 [Streptomyces sp. NPDC006654]
MSCPGHPPAHTGTVIAYTITRDTITCSREPIEMPGEKGPAA